MARSKRRAERLENGTAVGEDASSRGTEQAQPLVYDGVMYVTDARSTVAIDMATGRQISKTLVDCRLRSPASSAAGSPSKVRPCSEDLTGTYRVRW